MLGHPRIFVAVNIVLMFAVCTVVGIKGSIAVSLFMAAFVIVYNWRRSSIDTVVMAILYSMLFDSQLYSFTSLNLRFSYCLLLLLYIRLILKAIRGSGRRVLSFRLFAVNLPVVLLFGMSVAFLVTDAGDGRASSAKYWLFYVGMIYVLYFYFKKIELRDLRLFLDFLLSLAVFIALYGLFQYAMNLRGQAIKYMYDYQAFYPAGFFSETTWYAIYLAFGAVLALLRYRLFGNDSLFILLPIFMVGIFLSANRNAMVTVALVFAVNLCFVFVGGVVAYRRTFRNRYLLLSAVAAAIAAAFAWSILSDALVLIVGKFDLQGNASSAGRLVAAQESVQEIGRSLVLGSGFNWYPYQVTSTGTYMGSKSFNLLLMIAYIFGLTGFVPLLCTIAYFFFKRVMLYIRTKSTLQKYSFLLMAAFISASMFTPFHQQGVGMFVVALAAALGSEIAGWNKPDGLRNGAVGPGQVPMALKRPLSSRTS